MLIREGAVLDRRPVGRSHAAALAQVQWVAIRADQVASWSGAVWGPGEFAVKGFVVGDFGISFSPAYKMAIWPKRMPTKLIWQCPKTKLLPNGRQCRMVGVFRLGGEGTGSGRLGCLHPWHCCNRKETMSRGRAQEGNTDTKERSRTDRVFKEEFKL